MNISKLFDIYGVTVTLRKMTYTETGDAYGTVETSSTDTDVNAILGRPEIEGQFMRAGLIKRGELKGVFPPDSEIEIDDYVIYDGKKYKVVDRSNVDFMGSTVFIQAGLDYADFREN